jgi:hypothetical protein
MLTKISTIVSGIAVLIPFIAEFASLRLALAGFWGAAHVLEFLQTSYPYFAIPGVLLLWLGAEYRKRAKSD